ncbi:MAG: ASKHA domain-containing protein, partial [Oscillospiraceae bacterium]|nr:ASKHA domain-containing protein [Oscillospiraceae bacterium]
MMLGRIGVAIDIGTTTVVVHLVEMKSGTRLATASRLNAQSPYGADITSRIQYCIENGHELLTRLIREQISSMIIEVCETSKVNYTDIESLSIAANTVMQHLVVGYSPNKMGVSPYKTTSLFGQMLPAWEGMPVNKNTMIYYTPSISAFVGGDITAGILAAGIDVAPEPALFIDVGTNGEIVLKNKGDYICCSTAAGPAFEGAEIDKGMIAEDGAIDHLWLISNDQYNISVIGGGEPKGFCGSGLLDTLAMLLDTGAVDETGRLLKDSKYWLTKSDVGEGVYISASDIRKLQLAKAAIAAG